MVILIINLDGVANFLGLLWSASRVLVYGAMIAYVINLVMVRVESLLSKGIKKPGTLRGLSLLVSLCIVLLIVYLLLTIVIPSLWQAIQVLFAAFPRYFGQLQTFLLKVFEDNPDLVKSINSLEIDWKSLLDQTWSFLQEGVGSLVGTTVGVVNTVITTLLNGFLSLIFAIYLLLDKERFIRLYKRLSALWLSNLWQARLTKALRITHATFSSFIAGQCIEATILGTLCALGMMVLRMPYPLMIGILVGVINIIPMVGAYIGGAIGVFIIFTVNPMTSLGFLIYLCILQQIESNLIYPRVVGNSVGLPGIYVMVTIVIGGTLAGVPGMFLGIPTVASIYKILRIVLNNLEKKKMLKGS